MASAKQIEDRASLRAQLAYRLMLATLLTLCLLGTSRADRAMRVRLSWGGGSARTWRGVVQLSEGTLFDPVALGVNADEPGSMWLCEGLLRIRQRSPRDFDGVDLTLSAGLDAKLLVALVADGDQEFKGYIEIPLATLVSDTFDTNLDDLGTRLMIRRTPDDVLRVRLPDRDSMVFGPGERLSFDVRPYLLPVESGARVRLKIELTRAGTSDAVWSDETEVVAGAGAALQRSVFLPDQEGVYDLVLTARPKSVPWLRPPKLGQNPLAGIEPAARRKVQLVVVDPQLPRVWDGGEGDHLVEEIDPANPEWWKKIEIRPKLPKLKAFWKGPLGNGNTQTWQHPLGKMVRLSSADDGSDIGWEAYTLPIKTPGLPHVLEIDYPSDVPQTLGVTIIEPNAAGAVHSPGVDSGVELSREIVTVDEHPELLRHRLIFWPRTKAPIALLTNLRAGSSAVYGKIRVYDGWKHLPRAYPVRRDRPGRLIAAYMDRPLFPENFSATDTTGSADHLGVDDWVTFHEGGTRLVEYLNYVGFGGAMISVFADGGTIYPSRLLEPTPRYDTGILLDAGQDPFRKDVLELLLRLFDRAGLQLIPAMEFASPLPELETLLRRGGPDAEGVRWIGTEGLPLTEVHPSHQGMAPYYNVLHPRVQEAILRAVAELVSRYAHHPSFAGLSLQLSGNGYAQLPGPRWGLDDVTIGAFEAETGIKTPVTGTDKFAGRADFIEARCQAEWLDWRAQRLAAFYSRVEAELEAASPRSRLYLAGANVFAGGELQRQLKPTLPERDLDEALMQVGIDVARYRLADGPILLRPERVGPTWSLDRQADNLVLRRMLDTDRSFNTLPLAGSLFYHEPREIRLDSFDAKSPHQPSYTRLATEPVPSGPQNRRRFVHAVATLDSQVMFDGSLQLPLGQEDSIRELVAAYRQLPATRMQRLSDQPNSGPTQPVTIRYVNRPDGTYVCVVNDAPFAVTARIDVLARGGCRLNELTGRRRVDSLKAGAGGMYWPVKLEPYDLIAVRLSDPGAKPARARIDIPSNVASSIEARIADLSDRMRSSQKLRAFDFHEHPRRPALLRIVSPAKSMFQGGQVADCIGLLESYWPRFLVDNIPTSAASVTMKNRVSTPPASMPPREDQESPGFIDRLKGLVPKKFRF